MDDDHVARSIEQIVEARLQRDFARQLAADGFFAARDRAAIDTTCGADRDAAASAATIQIHQGALQMFVSQ